MVSEDLQLSLLELVAELARCEGSRSFLTIVVAGASSNRAEEQKIIKRSASGPWGTRGAATRRRRRRMMNQMVNGRFIQVGLWAGMRLSKQGERKDKARAKSLSM